MAKQFYVVFIILLISMLLCIYLANIVLVLTGLSMCDWPDISGHKTGHNHTNVMLLTDIHLAYDNNPLNYSENLWREFQMRWSFRLAVEQFQPQLIVILGDLFDDGINYDHKQFNELFTKFNRIFSYDKYRLDGNRSQAREADPVVYALSGNHDIGWHYEMTVPLKHRFAENFHTDSVQHFEVNGIHFVAIDSITMEGDNCQLCSEAESQLAQIGHRFCPNNQCPATNRPVILTHYPLYKDGLQKCGTDWDTRPGGDLIWTESIQKWNCLHSNATEKILNLLRPRLVFNGHTHYGCRTAYGNDTIEWTIASFNYRYLFSPTILLMRISDNDYSISKCHLTHGLLFYCIDLLIVSLFVYLWFKSVALNRHLFRGYTKINLS